MREREVAVEEVKKFFLSDTFEPSRCMHCGYDGLAHSYDGNFCPQQVVASDIVNHPPHYKNHPSGVECIEITEWMGFNLGNAMKYIWRADLKFNVIEDLEKARWYIAREIERRKRGI